MALLTRQVADYLERKRAQEIEQLLIRELNHRNNNQFALVSAIARRSFSDGASADALKKFEGRLSALARANHGLRNTDWRANLADIVRSTLEPYSARASFDGDPVFLGPDLTRRFSLVLHELASNAAKYGALSTPNGQVDISWTIAPKKGALSLHWRERGGPPVVAPKSHGFGTALLKANFGNVHIDYPSEGLRCEIDACLLGPGEAARDVAAGPSGRGL